MYIIDVVRIAEASKEPLKRNKNAESLVPIPLMLIGIIPINKAIGNFAKTWSIPGFVPTAKNML